MPSPPLPTADLDLILEHTRPLWEEMRGERIFITGGTGFFGCWLVESFVHINRALQLNARASILTRNPENFASKCPHLAHDSALSLLRGDVRDFPFPSGDYPFVIHAATEASAKQAAEAPIEMLTTIVDGTAHALNFAATHATRKLLLTSSGAVYGKQPANLTHIPEDFLGGPDALDPASVYAEGKRVSEQMCALQHAYTPAEKRIEIKIARCFAFVGPHLPLDAHFAIGNFIGDALANRPIRIGGDGTSVRSYLYAADLTIALWTVLFRAPSMQAFNIGSEHAINIRDLAHTIVRTLDPSLEVTIGKEPAAGIAPAQYVPSTQRAQGQLALKPLVPLEEAIRRTAAWHQLSQRQSQLVGEPR